MRSSKNSRNYITRPTSFTLCPPLVLSPRSLLLLLLLLLLEASTERETLLEEVAELGKSQREEKYG